MRERTKEEAVAFQQGWLAGLKHAESILDIQRTAKKAIKVIQDRISKGTKSKKVVV